MGPGTGQPLRDHRSPIRPCGTSPPYARLRPRAACPGGPQEQLATGRAGGHSIPDGLQHLLAGAKWQPGDIRDDLRSYIADTLGEDGGVLIIDDTGFVKKGITSAGVQRQHSGTAGRTENCQIGVFAAYASSRGRFLDNRDLYLPKSWIGDRERCRAAKGPEERAFATKGELARHIVLRCLAPPMPITCVMANAAYGHESRFRRMLEQSGVGYVLAAPKSQFTVGCPRIDGLFAQAPGDACQKISCGNGAKGPRVYHWAAVRLPAVAEFDDQGEVPHRMRRALACRIIRKPDEIAYCLAYAPSGTLRAALETPVLFVVAHRVEWAVEPSLSPSFFAATLNTAAPIALASLGVGIGFPQQQRDSERALAANLILRLPLVMITSLTEGTINGCRAMAAGRAITLLGLLGARPPAAPSSESCRATPGTTCAPPRSSACPSPCPC
ncbi:IS701 family transposase [Streptomyces sp. NPDC088925]|uniref:IS701 family transposase n=1 Tax=Streptomyces sp. NPDC088925 TaxID=3365914 RepID=UPI0038057F15